MRYILNDSGFIEAVSFNNIMICNNKTCTEYTGTIPTGYESLAEWNENANINAYKIVDGNLVFDSDEDTRLQNLWATQKGGGTSGDSSVIESGSNDNGNWIKWADGTMMCTRTIEVNSVSVSKTWGSLYYYEDLNTYSFAQEFIDIPDSFHIYFVPTTPAGCWLGNYDAPSITNKNFRKYALFRPTSNTVTGKLFVTATGKWK